MLMNIMEGGVEEGSGKFNGTKMYIYIVILGLNEIGCPFRYMRYTSCHFIISPTVSSSFQVVKDKRNDKTFAATWHFHNYQCSVVRS